MASGIIKAPSIAITDSGQFLPVNTDLNSITAIGKYYGSSTSYTNLPLDFSSTSFDLIVFPRENTSLHWQYLYGFNPVATYVRVKTSGSAWSDWYNGASELTRLTMTRVNNSWVDATSFDRLGAWKKNGNLYFYCNLATSAAGTFSDEVKIGSITGWHASLQVLATIAGQSLSVPSLLVKVDYDGNIFIFSSGNPSGFYRGIFSTPIKF